MQQPYIAYKPVLVFMAMPAPGSDGGDTTIGSGSSAGHWSSGSSGTGCWSPESEQVWEVESGDMAELALDVNGTVQWQLVADKEVELSVFFVADRVTEELRVTTEIGRASCRERV